MHSIVGKHVFPIAMISVISTVLKSFFNQRKSGESPKILHENVATCGPMSTNDLHVGSDRQEFCDKTWHRLTYREDVMRSTVFVV